MAREGRSQSRRSVDCEVVLSLRDNQGTRVIRARGVDLSDSGARVEASEPIPVGEQVFVRVPDFGVGGSACVRHCTKRGAKYTIGLELLADAKATVGSADPGGEDLYEIMQISPTAETETVQRVYRILATRFHPDNPHTGDAEKFLRLTQAYQVLLDPEKRAEYDSRYKERTFQPLPVFNLKEFVTGVDVESNRRLGILCLLYNRRRTNPEKPSLSLLELESLMTIPREHLLFTVWFLREKQYIRVIGGWEAEVSAEGAEFLESALPAKSVLRKLLRAPRDEGPGVSEDGAA
jgi:hypothetical protein